MKNWPMSGASQVVQGLGDLWNLLRKSVKSQVFISTRGELLEPLQRRAHALRPAPILAHDDESAQIELIDK